MMSLQTAFQTIANNGVGPTQFGEWLSKCNDAFHQNSTTDVDLVANAAYNVWGATTNQATLMDMVNSLTTAGTYNRAFHEDVVQNAFDKIYNKELTFTATITAAQKWQNSNVPVEPGASVTVQYQSGQWTANPATGMVDANGNSTYIAKNGYTLPGAYEGALIGRLVSQNGAGTPFLVGANKVVESDVQGYLELCINDDLNQTYGDGFADNQGQLVVKISVNKMVVPKVTTAV